MEDEARKNWKRFRAGGAPIPLILLRVAAGACSALISAQSRRRARIFRGRGPRCFWDARVVAREELFKCDSSVRLKNEEWR